MALAIPTLVARVVTLQQYCRLEGKVAEKEPAGQGDGSSELFKVGQSMVGGRCGDKIGVWVQPSTSTFYTITNTHTPAGKMKMK